MLKEKLPRRLFVDMDGTLAEWRATAKYEDIFEQNYFRSLRPQENVVTAVNNILRVPGVEVFILSAVLAEGCYTVPEKNAWLDEFCPGIDEEHRIFTLMPKSISVPGGIRKTDTLLDDYTVNLKEWSKHAVALKLLNGVNGKNGRWAGARTSADKAPEELVKDILSAVFGTQDAKKKENEK